MNYDHLREFATVRQLEYIEAIERLGSNTKAAKHFGVNRRVVDKSIAALKALAAKRSPQAHDYTKTVPEGYAIKGVSQFIDKDGKVAGQWVKTTADDLQREAAIKAAVEAMCEDIPRLGTIAPPLGTYGNLCRDVFRWL